MDAESPVPAVRRSCVSRGGSAKPSQVVTESFGHLGFPQPTDGARLVLTDSGGVLEAATALGMTCLTLRTTAERPVTGAADANAGQSRRRRVAPSRNERMPGQWLRACSRVPGPCRTPASMAPRAAAAPAARAQAESGNMFQRTRKHGSCCDTLARRGSSPRGRGLSQPFVKLPAAPEPQALRELLECLPLRHDVTALLPGLGDAEPFRRANDLESRHATRVRHRPRPRRWSGRVAPPEPDGISSR